MKITRPAWAEINLDNLANNIREVRRVTKADAIVTAVIKADGYGHGAVEIGQTLLDNGADRFAVATLSEAIQLRKSFPNVEILVLGYTPVEFAEEIIDYRITQTVYRYEDAKYLNDSIKEENTKIKLHIKLDTGMRRLGMEISQESADDIEKIYKLENIVVEGIFTHFAVADEVDKEFTLIQVKKFNDMIEMLELRGVDIPIKHVSNSAAIIDMPELNYNMVRAGIMLYGLYPSKDVLKSNVDLKEVMSLKVKIAHIKEIDKGEGISYGLKYKASNKMKIGTLPIGYADGFTRSYTGKAKGIINGEIAPIIGRICMDQCMIDLSEVNSKVDDIVTLFGSDDKKIISIDEYADFIETINYEVVCMISKRIPRVYTQASKVLKIKDWILLD